MPRGKPTKPVRMFREDKKYIDKIKRKDETTAEAINKLLRCKLRVI